MMRFLIPLRRFDAMATSACGPIDSRTAHWRNNTKIGPLPSRRCSFAPLEREAPPFASQFRHCPAGGVSDDRLRCKTDAISLQPRPAAPVQILGDAVLEPADRVENGTPDEHRGRDREVHIPDVALVLKSKDAFKRFGRRHPLRVLDEDIHSPAGKIGKPQFGQTFFEPALVGPTVAVDERDRLAPRRPNPCVAGGSRAAFGDLDHPAAAADDLTHRVDPARTAVVGDDDFRALLRKALRPAATSNRRPGSRNRRGAARSPIRGRSLAARRRPRASR